MATSISIVVIIFLIWNFAVLYLPFDKRKKAKLSAISVAVLALFALYTNARNYQIPACITAAMVDKPAEAKLSMMASFGIEERPSSEGKDLTPIELGVAIFVTFAVIFVPTFIGVVRNKKDDEEEEEQQHDVQVAHKIALILCSVALALLLSLYFGLKLTLLPFIKSRGQKTAEICKEGSRQPA